MLAFFLMGLGMVLAAIGITETVRGWTAGDGGLMQGLLGIVVAMLGAWLAGVAALRVLA